VPFNSGYVQHRPHVFVTFWGSEWNEYPGVKEKILGMYRWISGSSYQAILTQYFDHNGFVGSETDLSSYTDTRVSHPPLLNSETTQEEAAYSIGHQAGWGSPTYEDQYVVITPPGTALGPEACAAHGWSGSFSWTMIPWSPMACRRGLPDWGAMQVSASHEWAESVTDPIPIPDYYGWTNEDFGGEITDICNTGTPEEYGEATAGIYVAKQLDDYQWASAGTAGRCVVADSSPARFATEPIPPSISPHTAILRGAINPAGWPAYFDFVFTGPSGTQYLPNRNENASQWFGFAPAGQGIGMQPVSVEVGGLKGNTTYYVRLDSVGALTSPVAASEFGHPKVFQGGTTEFTTPDWHPLVQVEGASNRTTSSGTINGSVNPQGESTQYRFEWGPTSAYGSSVPVPDGQVGSGTQFVPVSAPISGLKPERTYHYRLVATNGEGTTVSGDKTFTTLALPPTYDFSFGALGSGAGQFNGPVGQMVDGSGNVWVADSANNRIEKFGRKGEFLFQFGTKGSSAGQMLEPTGVALSPNGTLWIADSGNGRIEQFTQQGAYLQQMGAGPEGMFGKDFLGKPVGIAVDPQGDIWVSDSRDQNVDHFQEKEGIEGHYRGSFNGPGGLPGENEFAGVAGVATDQEGDVFVVDSVNNWLCESKEEVILGVPIRKTYLRAGAAGSGVGQLNAPYGVAVKPSGNVLVAEKGNNRVQQFSPEGEWLASFGSVGAGAGQLSGPRGIAAGRGGTIYVSDFGNNRVERWNQPWTPEATTEAATGVKATEATLNATINPAGSSTTYQFEYGPSSPSYGSKAPATPGSAGSGADPVAKSQLLTGLKAETTYHYRIVATSNEGTVYGQDRTFSTIGPPYDFAFGSAGSGNGQFNGPGGVAVDASGNVWVVDRGNNRLEKFNASGQYLSQFGSKGSGNGQFLEPRDVAVTSAGNIWVTDAGNGRLQEFNSSGAFIRQVGVNEGTVLKPVDHLKEPYGLAIGSEGHVWVTDPGNCAVEVFTETSGNEKYFLAQQKASSPVGNPCESTERGAFRSPTGIAADGAGNAWAADGALNRVTQMKLSPPAIELGSWTISAPSMFGTQGSGNGAFQEPAGVALVGSKLSVADKGNNRVQQFSTAGEYQRQFGSLGSGAGQFSAPRGVAATPGGAQYITDPGNNRVEKWG